VNPELQAAAETLLGQVGQVRRTEIGAVPPLWSRRFALASGETDPIYFDDDAAHAAGWAGTPLPPLLLSSVRSWEPGPSHGDLAPDGMSLVDAGYPRGRDVRAMGGGQALQFHADALAGVELATEAEVTGATLKEGRSGDLLVVELERRFVTLGGEALVTCKETRLFR
jgi:acyl dehydratase